MPDLEEIRKKRMREFLLQQQMQQKAEQQIQEQLQKEQVEAQIKEIIHRILSQEARERLGNIRLANQSFARSIEVLLIQLYQVGKITKPLSDQQFKELLMKLKERKKRDIKIKRR